MDKEVVKKRSEILYPMFFSVCCALFSLKKPSSNAMSEDAWLEMKNRILQGSTHLLGLLVWRVQSEESIIERRALIDKLENVKNEVEELKKRRSEEGKANEKVLSIFAAHEQRWFIERKKLKQEIRSLVNELRVLESNKNEAICKLDEKVKEKEILVTAKDKALDEIEDKFKRVENEVNEVKKLHSNEMGKHKSAFIELVSTQRQFEAEMGRAIRQVEETKGKLDLVLEQKEELVLMNQRLSFEVVKVRSDLEKKDKILSAMLRKSKLDTVERQVLLNEVKMSKNKGKHTEFGSENWKAVKGRNGKHSMRSMLSKGAKLPNDKVLTDLGKSLSLPTDFLEYEQPEICENSVFAADYKKLDGWVRSSAEKYSKAHDKSNKDELEAFAEQLRLKDEKLEAYQWRLMSFEIESKRLISHIEGLNQKLSQLKQENLKMESLLLDQETELHSLKTQLSINLNSCPSPTYIQKANIKSSYPHVFALTQDSVWPTAKIIKRKPSEKDQETDPFSEVPRGTRINLSKDIVFSVQTPKIEFGEEKIIALDPGFRANETKNDEKLDPWKMDLHALGVSYKIKRLKQQLVMFEKLKGKQESVEESENGSKDHNMKKGYNTLISMLNKQVNRYISLQGNIDDLCKNVHENNITRTKGESKTLEQFLNETFHLQRYIVATGQKLMELHSKTACIFVTENDHDQELSSFDSKVFSECIKTLFSEVQRGVEVRISRLIGDLEGTLAREGIMHLSS